MFRGENMTNTLYKFLMGISFLFLLLLIIFSNSLGVSEKTLIYDVLLGVFLSAIFALLIDIIPENRKIKKGYKLIQYDLSHLIAELNLILEFNRQYFKIEKPLEQLTDVDWKVMFNKFDTDKEEFLILSKYEENCRSKIKNNFSIPAGMQSYSTLDKEVKDSLRKTWERLEVIGGYNDYISADERLIELLIQLKNSKLFMYIEQNNSKIFNNESFIYEDIYEIQKIYFDLKKMNLHSFQLSDFIIDNSAQAKKEIKDIKKGNKFKEYLINQQLMVDYYDSTTRIVYYYDNLKYKKLVEYMKDNSMDFKKRKVTTIDDIEYKDDVNVIIGPFNRLFKIVFSKKEIGKTTHLVCFSALLALINKDTKKYTINNQLSLWIIPHRMKILNIVLKKEQPSVSNLDRMTSSIVNEFRLKRKQK